MNKDSYTIGKYTTDSLPNRGWFIGTFKDSGAAKTDAVEIKYWEFPVGKTDHPDKISAIFECSIFIEGQCRGSIDGKEFEFSAGDYVAITPNTPNNLVMDIIAPVKGFTIKAPSDPTAKKII